MKILVFLVCLLGIVSAIQPKSKALPRFRQTLTVKHLLSSKIANIIGCNATTTAALRSLEAIIPANFDAMIAAIDATIVAYRATQPQLAGPNPTPITRTDPVAACILTRVEGDDSIFFPPEGSVACGECGGRGQSFNFPGIAGVYKKIVICNSFISAPYMALKSTEERTSMFGTAMLHEFGHTCLPHWGSERQHGALENWDNGFFQFFKSYYTGQGIDTSGWRDQYDTEWGHECTENRECATGHFCCTTAGCGAQPSHAVQRKEMLNRCRPVLPPVPPPVPKTVVPGAVLPTLVIPTTPAPVVPTTTAATPTRATPLRAVSPMPPVS